jgi:thiol-disulfide isomerase/thioredoxin
MNKKILFLSIIFILTLTFVGCSSTLGSEPEVLVDTFEIVESSSGFIPEGQILGGNSPYYIEFNEVDFKAALESQNLVILNYYANWCPSCKAEDREIREAFRSDNLPDTIAVFRTSFRDSDTTEIEALIAEEYGILSQGTKIVFVNGEQVDNIPRYYSKDQYLELFSNY